MLGEGAERSFDIIENCRFNHLSSNAFSVPSARSFAISDDITLVNGEPFWNACANVANMRKENRNKKENTYKTLTKAKPLVVDDVATKENSSAEYNPRTVLM